MLVSVERGDISGMSFGFRTLSDSWDFEQEPMLRTVNRAELVEITITSIPAIRKTSVQIAQRSMAEARKQQNPTALYQRWADLAEGVIMFGLF
ncbi:phage prohead protease, HK97 family [Pasteurella testudinis]|nr:phage prohead protease, HK97 family [Pasteurella testudinis]